MTRLLIVTAVAAERAAIDSGLGSAGQIIEVRTGPDPAPVDPDPIDPTSVHPGSVGPGSVDPGSVDPASVGPASVASIDLAAVGVGPAASAAGTARLLARAEAAGRPYQWVISAGIAGGFTNRPVPIEIGALVLATRSVAADLGADSPTGFLPLDQLGFGTVEHPAEPDLLARLRALLPAAITGTVLTVSTVTGTAARTAALTARYPDAVAEAMEGFGAAAAAAQVGTGFAEIRAISNAVGPRDRSGWQIPAALAALQTVGMAVGKLVG